MTKKIKWGIIGCGSVAEHKGGPALYHAPDSELIAVMSRDPAKAAEFAERHKARRCYAKIENILADNELDAVYVATPPATHAALTIKAAQCKKHVLCEKPMALNAGQCADMIAACRNNGVQLMIAFYRRRFPVISKIKELLDGGAIGRPVFARANVSALYVPARDGALSWKIDRCRAAGGRLVDVGSHSIDLMIYLLGEVREVAAFTDRIHFDFNVEDTASLMMRFRNKAHGMLSANWDIGARADEFEIAGTGGRIVSAALDKGEFTLLTGNAAQAYRLPGPQITHLGIVENFVKSILAGGDNCLPGEEGLKTTRVLEAAYQSSAERKVIEL